MAYIASLKGDQALVVINLERAGKDDLKKLNSRCYATIINTGSDN